MPLELFWCLYFNFEHISHLAPVFQLLTTYWVRLRIIFDVMIDTDVIAIALDAY